MMRFYYRMRCVDLFYQVQILLLEIIEIVGEEKEVTSGVTLRQFVERMDASFLDGIRAETQTSQLKIYLKDMRAFKMELENAKRNIFRQILKVRR